MESNLFGAAYLDKFKKSKPRTDEQNCADQIYEGFNKQLAYKTIIGLIHYKGKQAAIDAFNEIMKANVQDPATLWMWRLGQQKVGFK